MFEQDPNQGEVSSATSVAVIAVLSSLRCIVQSHVAVDRGHKHSNNSSIVSIWVSPITNNNREHSTVQQSCSVSVSESCPKRARTASFSQPLSEDVQLAPAEPFPVDLDMVAEQLGMLVKDGVNTRFDEICTGDPDTLFQDVIPAFIEESLCLLRVKWLEEHDHVVVEDMCNAVWWTWCGTCML